MDRCLGRVSPVFFGKDLKSLSYYMIMKHIRKIIFGIICIMSPIWLIGQPDSLIQVLHPGYEYWSIDSVLTYYLDSTQSLEPEEALAKLSAFQPYDSFPGDLPESVDLWAYVQLFNPRADTLSLLWATGITDSVTLYLYRKNQPPVVTRNGILVNVPDRDVTFSRGSHVRVEIFPQEQLSLLIHKHEIYGGGPSLNKILWEEDRLEDFFYSNRFSDVVLLTGFLCILGIIALYNLILFAATRTPTYGYYALYLIAIGTTLYFENITNQFPTFGFSNPYWDDILAYISFASLTIFYLQFGRSFLDSPNLTPKWDKAIVGFILLRTVIVLACTIYLLIDEDYSFVFNVALVLMMVETVFILAYFIPLIRSKSPIAWFFIAGSFLVFAVGFASIAFQNFGDLDSSVTGLLFLGSIILEILIFSLGLGYRVRRSEQEKLAAEKALNLELSKVNSAFGRFVPHEFLQSLGHESVTEVQLGDQVEKEVTVFFSDIRGYTTLSEGMTPAENFRFLNAYLGRVGPMIQARAGFVNQYYGDGIMALFLQKPEDALHAAIDIQRELRTYNEERRAKGRVPIKVGMGLHTGPLMMGIIGDQLRMDATVVADTVNTASRMEGLTKVYGVNLIVSETVVRQLPSDHGFTLRNLGKVLVKGRKQPLQIFECLEAGLPEEERQKRNSLGIFSEGATAYLHGSFP